MNEYTKLVAALVISLVLYVAGEAVRKYTQSKYEKRLQQEEITILNYLQKHNTFVEERLIVSEVHMSDEAVRYAHDRLYFSNDVTFGLQETSPHHLGWSITCVGLDRIARDLMDNRELGVFIFVTLLLLSVFGVAYSSCVYGPCTEEEIQTSHLQCHNTHQRLMLTTGRAFCVCPGTNIK